jgi:hypothetical protein
METSDIVSPPQSQSKKHPLCLTENLKSKSLFQLNFHRNGQKAWPNIKRIMPLVDEIIEDW